MVSLDLDPTGFVASAAFMKLGQTVSLDYRASDTSSFWGKLDPKESQPSFEKLGVDVGDFIWKLPSFQSLQKYLYNTASFDWGASSSEWQLARNWRSDSLQHPDVYWKLSEALGQASPLGRLIRAHLVEAWKEPQSASQPAALSALPSSSLAAFWEQQAELAQESLQKTLSNVKALLAEGQPAGSLEQAAWQHEELQQQQASEQPSGRFDGSELSLASGFGNQPLSLKLVLAEGLKNFKL